MSKTQHDDKLLKLKARLEHKPHPSFLKELCRTEVWEDGDPEAIYKEYRKLERAALSFRRHEERQPKKRRKPGKAPPPRVVKPGTLDRESVLATLLAMDAVVGDRLLRGEAGGSFGRGASVTEGEQGVGAFRKKHLGGEALSSEQVHAWIVEHAKAEEMEIWISLSVPITHGFAISDETFDPGPMSRLEISDDDGGVYPEPPIEVSKERPARDMWLEHLRYIRWGGDDWSLEAVPTSSRGVLEKLRRLSLRLAERYNWVEAQATNYVLTGEIPIVPELVVKEHSRPDIPAASRIIMTIDPEMSPKQVAEEYGRARRRFIPGRVRPLETKALALADFYAHNLADDYVARNLDTDVDRSVPDSLWSGALDEWNRRWPDWQFDELRRFKFAARQAVGRLLRLSDQPDT